MKKKIVIFAPYIPKLGGVETAMYNLAKGMTLAYPDQYEFVLAFGTAETFESLFHYAEYATVHKVQPAEVIECDTCLISSNHPQPPQIKAKNWLQWIHSDYEKYNNLQLVRNPSVSTYIAVSKHVATVSKRMFKIDPTVIYNMVDPKFGLKSNDRLLRLVTNSRISPEKGFARMLIMARALKEMGVFFRWDIYGDNRHDIPFRDKTIDSFKGIDEVSFCGFKENIQIGLHDADYLVQLSDFEGCPYAVLEALQAGVPVISTDYPSAFELIQNGKNGYIIPSSMEDVDYKKIIKEIPKKFKFSQTEVVEQWHSLL